MNKSDVIEFFDRLAPQWDADMIRDDGIIDTILDNADVTAGKDILDVACGTGVLIPDYLRRNVNSVTAVDISPEMIRAAQAKFHQENVRFICADAESLDIGSGFDCIMVYNAFPHFPEPEKLIAKLASMLRPGGTLTVAHGMSREAIDRHHSGSASGVSLGLMHEDDLEKLFAAHMQVYCKISDERMYQVSGRKV